MNNETFSFDLLDTDTPEVVIKNNLMQIEAATKGYVIGKIGRYGGPIFSYTKGIIWCIRFETLSIAWKQ